MRAKKRNYVRSFCCQHQSWLHWYKKEKGYTLVMKAQGLRRPGREVCRRECGVGRRGWVRKNVSVGMGCAQKESRSRSTFWLTAGKHKPQEKCTLPASANGNYLRNFFSSDTKQKQQLRSTFPTFTLLPTSPSRHAYDQLRKRMCQRQNGFIISNAKRW